MAHPRRVAKVSSQIQREISDMFVSDPVIQTAICPERRLGDDSLSAVASITHTHVTSDMQVAKIYVSVYSDDLGKRRAIDNLQRLEPYVRRQIGSRMNLRMTPEVRFEYDDSMEEADLVAKVIGKEDVERFRAEIEAEDRQGKPGGRAPDIAEEEDDGAGFFDDADEGEDGEYEDDEDWPEVQPQVYPDPFADLFQGEGDDLVQERGLAAKGKGQKQQPQKQRQQQKQQQAQQRGARR